MAERLELDARRRTVTGKKTRFLRRAGLTPANIYGHSTNSIAIELESANLRQVLRHVGPSTLVNLTVEGNKQPHIVMVRDVQQHPVTGMYIHVDFYQVRMTERLRIEVPLHIVGVSEAVERGGGILVQNLRTVEIEALPGNLPSSIEVDISGLAEVHSSLYVKDLKIPATSLLMSDPDELVLSIAQSRVEEGGAEGAAAAEPAVIARERAEEDEKA